MVFSKFCKLIVKKDTFASFGGGDRSLWIRHWGKANCLTESQRLELDSKLRWDSQVIKLTKHRTTVQSEAAVEKSVQSGKLCVNVLL